MKKYILVLLSVISILLIFGCPNDLPTEEMPATYSITITSSGVASGESVTTDVSTAVEGAKVIITANLNTERMVTLSASGITFKPEKILSNEGITMFDMPAADTVITATFNDIPPTLYTVNIIELGTLSGESLTADIISARAGTKITLTAALNQERGVELTSSNGIISSSEINSNGGTTHFIMPLNNVDINADFNFIPQEINQNHTCSSSYFGSSVDTDGDFVAVGTPGGMNRNSYEQAGCVYIFQKDISNWLEPTEIYYGSTYPQHFGSAVAISGNYLIVGAEYETYSSELYHGRAYLFKYDGTTYWQFVGTWWASGHQEYDYFGCSASIDGEYFIIGAQGESGGDGDPYSNAGAAYIYKITDSYPYYSEEAILHASDVSSGFNFGMSVSIDGEYAVVGAYGGSDGGAVYVYKNDGAGNWNEISILHPSSELTDGLGLSVDIDGDYIIAGAVWDFTDDSLTVNTGAAYIFKNDGTDNWNEISKLNASDMQHGDSFGRSVSIDGSYAVVSADGEDGGESDSFENTGAVYIYKNDGADHWSEIDIVHAPEMQGDDYFGSAVSVNNGRVIIGAQRGDGPDEHPAYNAGAAYIINNIDY